MKKTDKKSIATLPKRSALLIESLQNKKEAQAYLQASLDAYQEDDNKEALLLALRHLAQAQEQWHCRDRHCCFDLSWQKHSTPVRYCD